MNMKITEKQLRQLIKEEIKEERTKALIREFLSGLFGKKKKQQKRQSQNQTSQASSSMSTKDVGQALGDIGKNVDRLAKNAETEDMPDVASKIRDEGEEFIDSVKDSGMMSTQDYSKRDMFASKKKFKGMPKSKEKDDEDVVTSAPKI